MSHRMMRVTFGRVLPVGLFAMMAGAASGAEYYLRAEVFTIDVPDPSGVGTVSIPMWGFARDDSFEGAELDAVSVPGPRLVVPPGDTTLTIHLDNNLPEPISIVIAGQMATMSPVKFLDGAGRQRVHSFTHQTLPGNTTEVDYSWTGLKPGTYVYESGSHPAVQIQMGLYGAVTIDTAAGEAYPGVFYDSELMLFYSEIDPVLHEAVGDGSYGTTGPTSTIDYQPKYSLVNGEPYSATAAPLAPVVVDDQVLVRLINAGLRTHAPQILGLYMTVVAEDGNLYPYAREQYSLMLPAGKTMDALVTPSLPGTYPVFDRRLNLSNAGSSAPGGMLSFLEVDADPGP